MTVTDKPKRTRAKEPPIWCDHCGCDLSPANVRGCLRKTCATKALLDERTRADACDS